MHDPAAVAEVPPSTMFYLLGPVVVTVDDGAVRLGGPRQVAVLARLLLSPGQVVSMDQLAGSVWDGDCPARPEVAIRSYISNLRRSIEPYRDPGDRRSCIESRPPGYRLVIDPGYVDAFRLEALVTGGRRSLAEADYPAAVDQLSAAGRLWRGEPCEGMIETDALLGFRARLGELRLSLTELLFEARLGLGEHQAVICDLETAIAEQPLRERLTELGMLARYQAGRQSDALALFQALRARLVEELGIDPGPSVRALEHKILTHDPSLAPAAPAGPPPRPAGPPGPPGSDGDAAGEAEVTGHVARSRLSVPTPQQVIGRHRELRALAALGANLTHGRSASALITGEPGSGKSTLVTGLCDTLAQAQIDVGWGRCRAVASDQVLWPWRQVLEALAGRTDPALLAGLECLGALVPSLAPALDPSRHPSHGRRSGDSLALPPSSFFQPLVELLRRMACRSPLVVVVDDAHWADPASIELLAFAGAALAEHPVGFVVTWRDTELGGGVPRGALRSLARMPAATRIELGGLDLDAVEQLIEARGGASRRTAQRIRSLTAGNALLVTELVAGLAEELAADPAGPDPAEVGLVPPANVREAILDRVERAHPQAEEVLTAAALFERRFSSEVVAEVVDLPAAIVEESFDCAARAGLLVDDRSGERSYRFVHPISAAVLAAETPGPRRARLHAAIGHAMWRHGWPPADLAFHFSRASSVGTSILAARFALEAAARVSGAGALQVERAVEQGLEALERLDDADALQTELSSFLAQAARGRGDRGRYESMAERAVEAARRCRDDDQLAAAAMSATGLPATSPGLTAASWTGIEPNPERAAALLATCLSELRRDHPLWPALRVRECRLKTLAGADWSRCRREAAAAVDGLEAAEPETRRAALVELGRLVIARGTADERLWLAEAIYGLAEGPERVHDRLLAARLRVIALLEAGRVPAMTETLVRAAADVDEVMTPAAQLDLASLHIAVDLLLGHLDSAGAALRSAWSHCEALGVTTTEPFRVQLLALRWHQGGPNGFAHLARSPDTEPDRAMGIALLALAAAESGSVGECREHLDELAARPTWPAMLANRPALDGMSVVAVAAQRCAHRPVAKVALKALLAQRGSLVVAPRAEVVLGPASYFAGLAAMTTGKARLARELLAEAEQQARAIGAQPLLVRTLAARAEMAANEQDLAGLEACTSEAKSIASAIAMGWFDSWPRP